MLHLNAGLGQGGNSGYSSGGLSDTEEFASQPHHEPLLSLRCFAVSCEFGSTTPSVILVLVQISTKPTTMLDQITSLCHTCTDFSSPCVPRFAVDAASSTGNRRVSHTEIPGFAGVSLPQLLNHDLTLGSFILKLLPCLDLEEGVPAGKAMLTSSALPFSNCNSCIYHARISTSPSRSVRHEFRISAAWYRTSD